MYDLQNSVETLVFSFGDREVIEKEVLIEGILNIRWVQYDGNNSLDSRLSARDQIDRYLM